MKRFGIGLGIGGIVLAAACSAPGARPVTSRSGVKSGKTKTGDSTGKTNSDSDKTSSGSTDRDDDSTEGEDEENSGTGDEGTDNGGSEEPSITCDTSPGKAIRFAEKVKDMVAGDLGADATLGDQPRTIELWVKFTSANSWTAEQSILELGKPGQPDNGNNVFGIDMSGRNGDSGVFGPYTHGVSDNNGNNALPQYNSAVDAGWLHLSWSYDPSKSPASKRFEFTVNGNVLPTEFNQGKYDATGGKLVGNTGFLLLGASQNFGNEGWDGVMDEVRIWNVARTAQQVKDNMNVIVKPDTPGLIAYYQFNEADAANIKDSTGNAGHKLAACAAGGGACPSRNDAEPKFVDSDIPGAFTCAP